MSDPLFPRTISTFPTGPVIADEFPVRLTDGRKRCSYYCPSDHSRWWCFTDGITRHWERKLVLSTWKVIDGQVQAVRA